MQIFQFKGVSLFEEIFGFKNNNVALSSYAKSFFFPPLEEDQDAHNGLCAWFEDVRAR